MGGPIWLGRSDCSERWTLGRFWGKGGGGEGSAATASPDLHGSSLVRFEPMVDNR